LYIHYFGLRKLEAFFILLIFVMAVSFFMNMTLTYPDISEIAYGTIVPTIPSGALAAAVGLVGAVIMPHNLFLHSSLVLTRKVDETDKRAVNDANIYYAIESSISLFISFLINMSVIATFAAYS
jgi:natural resistance-associated macrophage protein